MGECSAAENWRRRCYKEEIEALNDVARKKKYYETVGLSAIGTIQVPVGGSGGGNKSKGPHHPGPPPSLRGAGMQIPRGTSGPKKSVTDSSRTSTKKGPSSSAASYPATPNFSAAGSHAGSEALGTEMLARLDRLELKLQEERALREKATLEVQMLQRARTNRQHEDQREAFETKEWQQIYNSDQFKR